MVLDLQAHCHVENPEVRSTEHLPVPRCSSFLNHQSWATLIIFRMGQKILLEVSEQNRRIKKGLPLVDP